MRTGSEGRSGSATGEPGWSWGPAAKAWALEGCGGISWSPEPFWMSQMPHSTAMPTSQPLAFCALWDTSSSS
ncbi:hypothetical protein SMICM17S_03045 [Streptomyces microflavus]